MRRFLAVELKMSPQGALGRYCSASECLGRSWMTFVSLLLERALVNRPSGSLHVLDRVWLMTSLSSAGPTAFPVVVCLKIPDPCGNKCD